MLYQLEEETGFDCSRMINPKAKYQTVVNAQSVTMFFVTGVDENFKFEPKTRMEIGVCLILAQVPAFVEC